MPRPRAVPTAKLQPCSFSRVGMSDIPCCHCNSQTDIRSMDLGQCSYLLLLACSSLSRLPQKDTRVVPNPKSELINATPSICPHPRIPSHLCISSSSPPTPCPFKPYRRAHAPPAFNAANQVAQTTIFRMLWPPLSHHVAAQPAPHHNVTGLRRP